MSQKNILLALAVCVVGLLFPLDGTATASASSVSAHITSFTPASGTYYPGDGVTSSVRFKNAGTTSGHFGLGIVFKI